MPFRTSGDGFVSEVSSSFRRLLLLHVVASGVLLAAGMWVGAWPLVTTGAAGALLSVLLLRPRLVANSEGLTQRNEWGTKTVSWEEIASIRVDFSTSRLAVSAGDGRELKMRPLPAAHDDRRAVIERLRAHVDEIEVHPEGIDPRRKSSSSEELPLDQRLEYLRADLEARRRRDGHPRRSEP